MSNLNILEVGDKIEFISLDSKRKSKHVSQILDILDKDNLVISGPIQKSTLIPMHVDEIIEVSLYKENKGKFVFNSKIVKRDIKKIYKLTITILGEIRKVQERNFFRLPISVNVLKKHSLLIEGENKIIEEQCVTEDLSGGGAKVLCNYKHNMGEKIVFEATLGKYPIVSQGIIVRIDKSNIGDFQYSIGIKFIDIKNEYRDKIIKFIFEEQRKLRKKGMI